MRRTREPDLINVISSRGFLNVYDFGTFTLICRLRVGNHPILLISELYDWKDFNHEYYLINEIGEVFHPFVNKKTFINFVRSRNIYSDDVVMNLAISAGLYGAQDLIQDHFELLVKKGENRSAAVFAAKAPLKILRTKKTLDYFKGLSNIGLLTTYLTNLIGRGKLNSQESQDWITVSIKAYNKLNDAGKESLLEYLKQSVADRLLEPSVKLGKLVEHIDGDLAFMIYIQAGSFRKVAEYLIDRGDYSSLLTFSKQVKWTHYDFYFILKKIMKKDSKKAVYFASNMPGVDPDKVVHYFRKEGEVADATSFLKNLNLSDSDIDSKIRNIAATGSLAVASGKI